MTLAMLAGPQGSHSRQSREAINAGSLSDLSFFLCVQSRTQPKNVATHTQGGSLSRPELSPQKHSQAHSPECISC